MLCTELVESIGKLTKQDKKQILKQMATALQKLATNTNELIQRVNQAPTLEGKVTIQRVSTSPLVTTSANPTAPATHKATPRTHMQRTRNNTPGAVPAIVNPDQILGLGLPNTQRSPHLNNIAPVDAPIITINSNQKRPPNQMPLFLSSIISQEAVNHITNNVYCNKKD